MGLFLEHEKEHQIQLKRNSELFSEFARQDGVYKERPRPFCLPAELSEENLMPAIREETLQFFAKHAIIWHDGGKGKPSNNLCDSQVCCVNFLMPFARQPEALAQVLRQVYPDLAAMLPLEDGLYVSFEWIGQKNYLSERVPLNGQRSRGAYATAADAIVMFERRDRKRQAVLIEWKYAESYSTASLKYAESGADRSETYRRLFEKADCPVNDEILPAYDDLFYEPFSRFFRQQLLANEMEKAREFGADLVSVLHVAPAHNADFRKITSPNLAPLGASPVAIWKSLLRKPDRFASASAENLFGHLPADRFPELSAWMEYIYTRYPWVRE